MGELGSIFEPEPTGERGPDLHFELDVPRRALGDPDGFAAPVPSELGHDGEAVPRAIAPSDPEGMIVLRLPEGFESGSTLRLRGQGGRLGEGQSAGDLYLKVNLGGPELVDGRARSADGRPTTSLRVWPAIMVLLAVLLVLWFTWR